MINDIAKYIGDMIFAIPDKYQSVYDMYEKNNMKHKEMFGGADIKLDSGNLLQNAGWT